MTDPAAAWLKANDPEASTPGYGDRYSAVPRRQRREIPASALDRVDDHGNVKPFDAWYPEPDVDEPGGAYVPAELQDVATLLRPVPRAPVSRYRKALAERLTAAEMSHLAWIERGDSQGDIVARLGIGQSAVSKRERILLAKVAEIHLLTTGRPYPLAARRRPGARGRQKPPVGQE